MKRKLDFCLLVALLLMLGLGDYAVAGTKTVQVIVTNATTAQPLNPLACWVHDGSFKIYELGQKATEALHLLAEDADTSALQTAVDDSPNASSLVIGGAIPPGGTVTVDVEMKKKDFLSCAMMLVNTNDTFTSITDVRRPKKREVLRFEANAWDAGTEVNDQLADNIPGPCCGDTDGDGVEEGGVVLGSPGIVAGLGALIHEHDWRGYVAKFIVRRQ